MKIHKKLFLLVLLVALVIFKQSAYAESCEDTCEGKSGEEKTNCLAEVKKACQEKLNETSVKKQTLQSAITFLDTKIKLTQSQINQTIYEIEKLEDEIKTLEGKIVNLDLSLDQITLLLSERIKQSYKNSRVNPVNLFISSNGFTNFISRYKYLKIAQNNDRNAIIELEKARADYDKQKTTKEEVQDQVLGLQTELLTQKTTLDKQQKEKEYLLVLTKHDESRYQDLLSKANAELAAIQAIIAGKGNETKVGQISSGAKIATIIRGASTCSNGGHLHLEVVKNGANHNPFSYLSSHSLNWDNLDSVKNGSGSWPWPLNDPIRITQDYGMTYYARNWNLYGGGPHTGVDMVNDDYEVKSVQPGILYRGSISCKGGTLRYVRVEHDDDIDTYYLHVNYF